MLLEKIPYPNVKILLIEDNPGDARLIEEMLNDAMDFKHDLIFTTSLSEGLEYIDKEPLDVILLDLSLPDSKGFETIFRTREKAKNIPIVVLTGLSDENYARKAVQAGAQDYLIKGQIDSNPLVRSIYHAIDRHKMMQTIESLASTLQQNETQLKKIINMNADCIVIVDNNGIVCFVNPAAEKFFGRIKSKFIGEFFGFPTVDSDKTEIEIIREDGQIAYAEIRSVEIEWEKSKAYLLTLRDISEHKQFEQHLKESEEKYRGLYDSIKDGILLTDMEGKILEANQAYLDVLGYSLEEIKELTYIQLTPEKWHKKEEDIVKNQIMSRGYSDEYEKEYIKKDGNVLPISIRVWLIQDKDGNPEGMWGIARDITEHKQMEKEIKESEEKYRILVENSLEGVWAIDFNSNTTFVNQRMAEILGYSVDEMIGKNLFDFMSAQLREEAKLNIDRRKQGIKETHDFEFLRKNGTPVYTRIETSPLITKDGLYNGALAYVADITEKKIAEEKLKESEKKYRDLFENSPYPIIILNLKGDIIDVNSSVKNLFGYSKSEILNQNYKNSVLFTTNYLDLIENAYEKILLGNIPEPFEIKFLKKNDSLIWINLNFSLIKQSNETLIHILIQNVTEIRSSKLKLKKLEQALQELDALIESAPLPIFLIDAKGKILRANEEAELLVRFSKTELVNFQIFDFFTQDILEIAKKYYYEHIYISSKNKKIEMSIKRKDGKIIDVEITSKIIKIEDQNIIQSIFSDISERKEFELNRQNLLDQLFISLDFKSKFLASISHEIRTPLNSILGFSQLLLEKSYGKLNIEQKDFIKDINSAGSHLLTLINSILDMSRIEAGKLELYREKFRLKEIIKNINSIVKPLYEKKNLLFNVKGIKESEEIFADILRFKQILFNLLSNAINFTNEGSITLCGIQRTDHWEFQVQDTGIGIKKEDFKLIFKEFGRINSDLAQEVQGTGLGLALTKRLVQLQGGEIWFESEFGKGTTFYFTIPMV